MMKSLQEKLRETHAQVEANVQQMPTGETGMNNDEVTLSSAEENKYQLIHIQALRPLYSQ